MGRWREPRHPVVATARHRTAWPLIDVGLRLAVPRSATHGRAFTRSSGGVRVEFSGRERRVIDGPFAETKERRSSPRLSSGPSQAFRTTRAPGSWPPPSIAALTGCGTRRFMDGDCDRTTSPAQTLRVWPDTRRVASTTHNIRPQR